MISAECARRFTTMTWPPELSGEARGSLTGFLEEARSEAGTELYRAGQPNDRVYFLLEGQVEFWRNYHAHGEECVVRLDPGAMFGVTSFFGPNPPLVTARAVTPVWYVSLSAAAYDRLRETNLAGAEQFSRAAIHILSDRFDLLDRRLSEFFSHSERGRFNEWNEFRARIFKDASI